MGKLIYDIRTKENAQRTLTALTGVPFEIWNKNSYREKDYKYTDDFLADIIKTYGHMPSCYRDFEFVYFHITTSGNGCESIKKHGLVDLPSAYLCSDSELRIFLEKHNIIIDLERCLLKYNNDEYDISNGKCPQDGTKEYNAWRVGNKIYYDYTSCGFLSVYENSPYGGAVHKRPEILLNIDRLLKLKLSYEWAATHKPFEVVVKVSGDKIICHADENNTDEEKVLCYLTKAYYNMFDESEHIVLLKNGISIVPEDILEVKPLSHWENYL